MSAPIRHHPDALTMMSFAAATLAEPLAAVVAAHIALCRKCRAEVASLEAVGAALLLGTPEAPGAPPVEVPGRLTEPGRRGAQSTPARGERLPAPIALAYGLSLEQVPWKRLGPGVWHHRLPLLGEGTGDLRLLRISPGRTMPEHGHGGTELTLVIEGSFGDITGEYRRGDIQDVDEMVEHQPVVGTGGECICLIASEQKARFKSLVGRLLQPWTGI